jgi:hypothetical protein
VNIQQLNQHTTFFMLSGKIDEWGAKFLTVAAHENDLTVLELGSTQVYVFAGPKAGCMSHVQR